METVKVTQVYPEQKGAEIVVDDIKASTAQELEQAIAGLPPEIEGVHVTLRFDGNFHYFVLLADALLDEGELGEVVTRRGVRVIRTTDGNILGGKALVIRLDDRTDQQQMLSYLSLRKDAHVEDDDASMISPLYIQEALPIADGKILLSIATSRSNESRHMTRQLVCFLILVLMRLDGWNLGFGQTGLQPGSFATVTQDHKTAYIISADQPGMVQLLKADALTARDTDNLATRAVLQTAASSIVDMQVAEPTEELLILCDHPPRLIRQPLSGAEATTIPLAAPPARLAVQPATDARKVLVCVTLPQAQAVWLAHS